VQGVIKEVLHEKLDGATYHSENTSQWTREIADGIKWKLKALGLERYKFVVQVVIGEQRGEGIR
jgi:tctex1 domain-containing protein 2